METDYCCGLENQGFTCYLNALLQTLFRTPEFTNLIRSSGEHALEKALHRLFKNLSSNSSSVGIEDVTDALQIDVMKQQDIAECFRRLLNVLDKKTSIKYSKIFQSTVVNTLECHECHNSEEMEQDLSVIALPVKPHLMESLEEFWKSTTLEGQNEIYCDECCKKTVTETKYTFKCLPSVLVIQLKRIVQHLYAFEKDSSVIHIPLQLEIPYGNSKDKPQTEKYWLYAVCDHSGGVNSGHYKAFVKCREEWVEFNDKYFYMHGFVQQNDSSFIRSRNAYLLFYQKGSKVKVDECGQLLEKSRSEGTVDKCKQLQKKKLDVKIIETEVSFTKTYTVDLEQYARHHSTSVGQHSHTSNRKKHSPDFYATTPPSYRPALTDYKPPLNEPSNSRYFPRNPYDDTASVPCKPSLSSGFESRQKLSTPRSTKDCTGDFSFGMQKRSNSSSPCTKNQMPVLYSSKSSIPKQCMEPRYQEAYEYSSGTPLNTQNIVESETTSKREIRPPNALRKVEDPTVKSFRPKR